MDERRWRLTKDGEQERPYLWSDKYQDWLPRDELLPPPPSGPSLTDAEVLAEMGGERMWYCYSLGSVRYSPRPSCKTDDRCGWVWIVKEAAE